MTMDNPGIQNSPPLSDHTNRSWGTSWDIEDGSVSGLHLEHSHELNNLVEDKDLAARAVAFVVSSTRKGVVPLCADVANLLKSKRCLERKLHRLKGENEILRRSAHHLSSLRSCSHSTSPTPQSIPSYNDPPTYPMGKYSPTCSRCSSQSSSLVSISPKPDKYPTRSPRLRRTSAFSAPKKSHRGRHVVENQNDQVFVDNSSHIDHLHGGSHLGHMTSPGYGGGDHLGSEVTGGQQLIVAEVHSEAEVDSGISDNHGKSPDDRKPGLNRKNSLPEITDAPRDNLPKVSPRSVMVSAEVQCSLPPKADKNSMLEAELAKAKKEIEELKLKLDELKMKSSDPVVFHVENEIHGNESCCHDNTLTSSSPPISCHGNTPIFSNKVARSNSDGHQRKSGMCLSPTLIKPPVEGCGCGACELANSPSETNNSTGFSCDQTLLSARLQLDIDDRVLINGHQGTVKYLGHVDDLNQSQPFTIYVGVVFDDPVGHHDGTHNGKRYFLSPSQCAEFASLEDIECITSKKTGRHIYPSFFNPNKKRIVRQESAPKLTPAQMKNDGECSHVV